MAPKFIIEAGHTGTTELLGGTVLGVGYQCESDKITFKFPPTFQLKGKGGTRTPVKLSLLELSKLRSGLGTFSLRAAASYVMSQYDPLGLVSPISLKAKLLLRRSHSSSKGWSQELPRDIKMAWGELATELQEAGTIFFPRSTAPACSTMSPILVGFGDGSTVGFGATVYVVWPGEQGEARVCLVMAKSRVAPLGGTSVPRTEMSSAALLARLTLLVLRASGFRPQETVMALDSECSVAALKKKDGLLRPFFSHRAAEVNDALLEMKSICPLVQPVLAVRGEDNPADLATRGLATASDLGPASSWQRGPPFLQTERGCWPLRGEVCSEAKTSSEEVFHRPLCTLATMVAPNVSCAVTTTTSVKLRHLPTLPEIRLLLGAALRFMHFTSCWHKATRILARFVRGFLCRDREAARDHPSAAELRSYSSWLQHQLPLWPPDRESCIPWGQCTRRERSLSREELLRRTWRQYWDACSFVS